MGKYQEYLTVTSAEADSSRRLKPFALLCQTQEIANRHATSLDFGYNQLIEKHQAWVLSRIKVKYLKFPLWQSEYIMRTWHKGLGGPFSLRDFEILSPDGTDTFVICTSSWLILDLDSRRMLRTDHAMGEAALSTAWKEDAIAEPCGKLSTPQSLEYIRDYQVRYSDIDFNLHANNAKYLEWALDCLDSQLLISREIAEFQLNINHETHIGDCLQCYTAALSKDEYYIEGKIQETNIFQTLLKFKP